MKDQVATEVAACLELARGGWRPPSGELLLVVTSDEETGATRAPSGSAPSGPRRCACDYVVNEGAGVAIEFGGRRFYTLAVGEKGVFRFWLRTRGVGGHGSLPRVGDNALLKLAPLIERCETSRRASRTRHRRRPRAPAGRGPRRSRGRGRASRAEHAPLADLLVEPMLGVTLTPTKGNTLPRRRT